MKLNNCRSEKVLTNKQQQTSPQDQLQDQSPEVSQLIQKLQFLQEKQQKTKHNYLNKIQQLKNILTHQNLTTIQLEGYIQDLRSENQKQQNYLQNMKKQLLSQISSNDIKQSGQLQLVKSTQGLPLSSQNQSKRQKSQGRNGIRLLKSTTFGQKRSNSKSSSRSKLSLFKVTSTLFGKNSHTLLKQTPSTKDIMKIQSEYYQQNCKKL